MTFIKGASGNPNGRPIGAKGKKTEMWNEMKDFMMENGMKAYKNKLQEMLESDNPIIFMEAMKRFEALLEYFAPKLARTTLANDEYNPIDMNPVIKINMNND